MLFQLILHHLARPDKDEEYAIRVASSDDKILTEYTPLNSKNEVGRGGSSRGGNRLHKNKTKKHKKYKKSKKHKTKKHKKHKTKKNKTKKHKKHKKHKKYKSRKQLQ
jgi:hypothetical protein